jgi:predicted RNA-binding Zn ribbon-like protein
MRSVDLESVLAFANTLDERRFGHHAAKAERDRLATAEEFAGWLAERDLLDRGSEVSEADIELARRLRDGLRDLLRGDDRGAGSLAALVRELPLVAAFEGGRPALAAPGSGVQRMLGSVLAACVVAAIDGRWARVKMCAADDCRFVFYDYGRNRLGRWCAMQACGNRMKSRSYRARQATPRGAGA